MPARKTVKDIHSARETKQPAKASAAPPKNEGIFPIVGIGASAGGLAAFEAFFSGMPADSDPGMAFVLIQHLAPDHKSLLTEIVSRYTRMQVFEVENGMAVKPNCVYIIPPKHDMALRNGALQLLEPSSQRGQRLPIDFFFQSLAQDQHERAICIILSGTGSDGVGGIRAIKGEGGLVLAQNPESSDFGGMPGSAIATGLVDYILPPAEMPAQLISYVTHMFGKITPRSSRSVARNEESLDKIYGLLRSRTGHDFSQYKKSTICRRIERRMAVHRVAEMGDYVLFLQQSPSEVDTLFNDLLIGVTSFFRDADAFKALAASIPRLFMDKPPGSLIRIWTCGCSTGEEAYSIAILLQEQMELLKRNFKVQLFATDIDNRAVDFARSGIYPQSIAHDVSPERLTRFFVPEPDNRGFRISKNIRDMLIFSRHDLIGDPPFSKMDLISCRNLLIYMNSGLQKKLIPLFHYSLNPSGMLFLGTSESIGEFTDLFSSLDRQHKLYLRKDSTRENRLLPGKFQLPKPDGGRAARQVKQLHGPSKLTPRELSENILLQKYAPVGVLVSEQGDIVYLHGRTGRFLEFASGDIGVKILKTAREGLRHDLTVALHRAATHNEPVSRTGLRVKTNGDFTTVNLTVEPLTTDQPEQKLYLVVLEDAPATEQFSPVSQTKIDTGSDEAGSASCESRIALLTQELLTKEEYLHSANEELETSNEELKSTNEEMQSLNEELQSTNEELETSREELQSVNEELTTVNAELYAKVMDLSRANNDMNNLLAGTGVGTVFIDSNLRIQRFTPAATEVINLIQTDVGRPLGHVVSNLSGYNRLVEDVQDVLNTLASKNIEVTTKFDAWFLMCIRPYRTLENDIEGAVITFTNISEQVKSRDSLQRLAVLMKDGYDAITVQDLEGRILAWNPAAEKIYGWSEAEALAMNIRELIPGHLYEDHLEKIKALSLANVQEPYHTQKIAKNGRTVEIILTTTALVNNYGQIYGIATTERVKP